MKNELKIFMRRFKKYMRRTYKNKLGAIAWIMFGCVTVPLFDYDGTFLFFTLLTGIPVFFCRKSLES